MTKKNNSVLGGFNLFLLVLLGVSIAFVTKIRLQVIDTLVIKTITETIFLDIIRLHVAFYIGLLLWVGAMLIKTDRNRRFKTFLIFITPLIFIVMDFVLTMITRATGSGIAFNIVNHYNPLLQFGFPLEQLLYLLCGWFLPLLIVLPLFIKGRRIIQANVVHKNTFLVLTAGSIVSFTIAMLPPLPSNISKGITTNAVAYLIKTTLHPLPDIIDDTPYTPPQYASKIITPKAQALPYNIALILLESTRAMSISHYNKNIPQTTPFIDELARNSLVAKHAYAPLPSTSKSMLAMHCGIEPFVLTRVIESNLGLPIRCLPDLLTDIGYATIAIHSATRNYENMKGIMKTIGFKKFIAYEDMNATGFSLVNYFGYEEAIVLEPSKKWLTQQNTPFFALYATNSPHHPYGMPYAGQQFELSSRYGSKQFSKDDMLNHYHQAINHVDHFIKALFQQYKDLGLYRNTLFVIVGDHAESFGQYHRPLQHNNNLYNEGIHIPLLIHNPVLIPKQKIISRVTSLYDIAPTLTDLLNLKTDKPFRGLSLLASKGHEAIYSKCWYDDLCLSRTDENYKYIYNFEDMPEELYDLKNDPTEQNNIAAQHPDQMKQFRQDTHLWYNHIFKTFDRYYKSKEADYMTKMAPKTFE